VCCSSKVDVRVSVLIFLHIYNVYYSIWRAATCKNLMAIPSSVMAHFVPELCDS